MTTAWFSTPVSPGRCQPDHAPCDARAAAVALSDVDRSRVGAHLHRGRPARAEGHAHPPPSEPPHGPGRHRRADGENCSGAARRTYSVSPDASLGNARDRRRGRARATCAAPEHPSSGSRPRRSAPGRRWPYAGRSVSARPTCGLVGLRRSHALWCAIALASHADALTRALDRIGRDEARLHRSGAPAQTSRGRRDRQERASSLRHLQRLLRADARPDDDLLMRGCSTTTRVSLDAQRAKLDRICRLLELTPEDELLEIGTRLGQLRDPRRVVLRLPGDDNDDLRRTVRPRPRAGGRGGTHASRHGSARPLPRSRRPIHEARFDRDVRGGRLARPRRSSSKPARDCSTRTG